MYDEENGTGMPEGNEPENKNEESTHESETFGQAGDSTPGDPYGGNVQYKWNYDDYQKALNSKKKNKNKGLIAFVISVCSIFGVAVVALAGFGIYSITRNGLPQLGTGASTTTQDKVINQSGPTLNVASQPGTASKTTQNGQLSVQQCAKKVLPSVVGIVDYSLNQIGEIGEGSGIIMSADGYIVTNNHVIENADRYRVVLADGTKYDATLVGTDTRTDIAVLKINAKGLTPAAFGNSSQLQVGDPVIAIGNPGGLELAESVTQGIVSALNRTITTSDSSYSMTYIQTDASINPGNSGGALVNMYGQIVGINAAKISDVNYEGIGFSIPVNLAQPVVNSIIKYGYVKDRVKLGITCSEFDEYQSKLYGLPQGLLIASVDQSSDVYVKGLRKNDIITKVNGKAVTTYQDLLKEEDKYKPGQSITLTICRVANGSARTFSVSVKLMEDRGTAAATTTTSQTQQDQNGND